ncbi:hypothetical protein DXG01_013956 [Tephrocybe rancida]|nr:hypothetical protein DXG01_013956 [Tephrocybe rancida]
MSESGFNIGFRDYPPTDTSQHYSQGSPTFIGDGFKQAWPHQRGIPANSFTGTPFVSSPSTITPEVTSQDLEEAYEWSGDDVPTNFVDDDHIPLVWGQTLPDDTIEFDTPSHLVGTAPTRRISNSNYPMLIALKVRILLSNKQFTNILTNHDRLTPVTTRHGVLYHSKAILEPNGSADGSMSRPVEEAVLRRVPHFSGMFGLRLAIWNLPREL